MKNNIPKLSVRRVSTIEKFLRDNKCSRPFANVLRQSHSFKDETPLEGVFRDIKTICANEFVVNNTFMLSFVYSNGETSGYEETIVKYNQSSDMLQWLDSYSEIIDDIYCDWEPVDIEYFVFK